MESGNIILTTPSSIHGEKVAGEAAKARSELVALIENQNKSTFDIAERLAAIKAKGYYEPYTTFQEFTSTLKIKQRKSQYLVKMVEVMNKVGVPRTEYEPLGIARLREITSLNPDDAWTNPETGDKVSHAEFIKTFVEKGEVLEMEDLKTHVRHLKGFVGAADLVWLNYCVTRSAAENSIKPAIEKMKMLIGSVGKDEEGISQDPSDGSALEMMAVTILTEENLEAQQ